MLNNDFYNNEDRECICPNCVFNHDSIDLFKLPNDSTIEHALKEIEQSMQYLNELLHEKKIDHCISPFLVSIFTLENVLGKTNLSLEILRKNALILGYIHSFIQYLWYSQSIKEMYPKLSEKELNKIIFKTSDVINSIEPIEISNNLSNLKEGYVIFLPTLNSNGDVDMEYKLIIGW